MASLTWWMLYRFTEATMPVHDPPAVWKTWGLWGGGLPRVEAMPLAPVTKPRYGYLPDDGLPTLVPLPERYGVPAVLDRPTQPPEPGGKG